MDILQLLQLSQVYFEVLMWLKQALSCSIHKYTKFVAYTCKILPIFCVNMFRQVNKRKECQSNLDAKIISKKFLF